LPPRLVFYPKYLPQSKRCQLLLFDQRLDPSQKIQRLPLFLPPAFYILSLGKLERKSSFCWNKTEIVLNQISDRGGSQAKATKRRARLVILGLTFFFFTCNILKEHDK